MDISFQFAVCCSWESAILSKSVSQQSLSWDTFLEQAREQALAPDSVALVMFASLCHVMYM